jgi:hypothetical protein
MDKKVKSLQAAKKMAFFYSKCKKNKFSNPIFAALSVPVVQWIELLIPVQLI